MKVSSLTFLALFLNSTLLAAQTPAGAGSPLARHYREGQRSRTK
jgi:hypothetical protein